MGNLTEFGKAARRWRIEHDLSLGDMAEALGTSSAVLSAVEHGDKPMPKNWLRQLTYPDFEPVRNRRIREIQAEIQDLQRAGDSGLIHQCRAFRNSRIEARKSRVPTDPLPVET